MAYPPRIEIAGPIWDTILRRLGYAGVFVPSGRVYILWEYINHEPLRRHELAHAAQCRRLGSVKFWTLYLWYALTVGYRRNPLEIEARAAEGSR
jgi:hypothetical protein